MNATMWFCQISFAAYFFCALWQIRKTNALLTEKIAREYDKIKSRALAYPKGCAQKAQNTSAQPTFALSYGANSQI